MFKADGSFLIHDYAGGYRPLNCIRREFRPRFLAQVAGSPLLLAALLPWRRQRPVRRRAPGIAPQEQLATYALR